MKILIINHYVGSSHYGMDYRQYYLAKEWVKLGHEVSILGAGYSHLRTHQPVVSKDLQPEWIEGIRYIWIKTPRYQSSGYKRILNMLAFIMKALLYSRKIARRISPEAVIVASTYVLDVYPAWFIARKARARLIYELHDLWPLSPMVIGGYSKRHPFIRLVQLAENFACHQCDYFISVLGNAKEYLVEHGMKEERFVFVSNGFSEDHFNSARMAVTGEHKQLLKRLKSESRIIVGYTGGHAPSNALHSFVQAAKMFSLNPDLVFVLVGKGSEKEELIKLANSQNGENIYFLPPVAKNDLPDLLSYCDILYAGGVSSVIHKYGTAFNKITDYMLAGKPVVFAVDEPNSLIEQVGCGIQVPAENVSEIARAIESLRNLSPMERMVMGFKGRDFAEKELGYSSIAKKILEAIGVNKKGI